MVKIIFWYLIINYVTLCIAFFIRRMCIKRYKKLLADKDLDEYDYRSTKRDLENIQLPSVIRELKLGVFVVTNVLFGIYLLLWYTSASCTSTQ